jgi:hypothetical protein
VLSRNVLYYGKEEALPPCQSLRAGPLSIVFEAGDLRYIRLGDREILRRVYVAVRDRNWDTVPAVLTNLLAETDGDSFHISYDAQHRQGDIDFVWTGRIEGNAAGTIRFSMEGEARSTFLRNRIGFCVLHPMRECAGQPCEVEKVDGSVERSAFPKHISPHQPFMDMRAISHEVLPGLRAEVRFAGDTFEMEDQRNWTDASFKTYCTPLSRPYPVEIRAGDRVSQSVTLTLSGDAHVKPVEHGEEELTFLLTGEPSVPLPRIGLGVASHGRPLTDREIRRLSSLNQFHLRVDLCPADREFPQELHRATKEAQALGVALEIALHLTDAAEGELEGVRSLLDASRPPVSTWLIFHTAHKSTPAVWIELARKYLSDYDSRALFGAGTNAFFTELNRERPPAAQADAICYSINPQAHAFDNTTLIETLEAQAATVDSARQFSAGKPIVVSPITLKPRFNPNATGPEPDPGPGELPAAVDPRQMSLFGAGWTLGSLKYLAESGAASVTYYETTGWRGVMETEQGSPLPDRFHSLPGAVFPLYHILADVGEFAAGKILPTRSSSSLQIDGLMLRKRSAIRTLVANLTPDPQQVRVEGLPDDVYILRVLDETNAEEAMRSPQVFRARPGEQLAATDGVLTLSLRPYAIARIDGG